MGLFKNDLDKYISLVQTEEIFSTHNERFQRHQKQMKWGIGITTGAVAATTFISIQTNNPTILLLNVSNIVAITSAFNLYNNYQANKGLYKIDYDNLENIDYHKLAAAQRERKRRQGKIAYESPSNFHRKDAQEIIQSFGYDSDNDLPIQFLEKEKVANQVLAEYKMFNKKYELPPLKVTKENLDIFIDELENLLKEKMLSHRIYFYTSEYFKRLYAKGLINYWDDITINTIINQLNCFESLEYTNEQIEEFKTTLRDKLLNIQDKKLKK